ncbi:hypothetical protein Tco_0688551 [Tanacetum coccineum]
MGSGVGVVAKAVAKPRQLWRATTATILLSLKEAAFKFQQRKTNALAPRGFGRPETRSSWAPYQETDTEPQTL